MQHSYSNIAGTDMPRSDKDGGYSIEPRNIEEGGNPVADYGGSRPVSTQAQQQASQTGVGDHNAKIRARGLKKYRGVSPSGKKWIAGVGNRSSEHHRVHLGTFPTPEMAAIAFDTSTLFLRGQTSVYRLNFPQYASHIKDILKGCSCSVSTDNIRAVAWKAAYQLCPLMNQEKKDRRLEASSRIDLEAQKHQGLEDLAPLMNPEKDDGGIEVLGEILAATSGRVTSTPMISSNSGMFDSNSDVYFPVLPSQANQRIEAAACAAGSSRRVITSADQLLRQIPDGQEESMKNNNNQQIQHWQSRSYMSPVPHSGIASSSALHDWRSTPADCIQDVSIPSSNPNSMPVQMENSGGVGNTEDYYYMDNRMLMEYPLRYSPDCVGQRPVPGVNTHPAYLWDNRMLMEYPLRYSPDCVGQRPVPGVNTHPAYLWYPYQ